MQTVTPALPQTRQREALLFLCFLKERFGMAFGAQSSNAALPFRSKRGSVDERLLDLSRSVRE